MRRATFRVAFAGVLLGGCAAVLGIDELPVPDVSEEGTPDAATADHAAPDATNPPADDGAVTDTGLPFDAGPDDAGADLFFAPTTTFDPSAVFWSDGTLYIADNDTSGSDGGLTAQIWKWTGSDTLIPVVRIDHPAGVRFGQIIHTADPALYIPAYKGDSGVLWSYSLSGTLPVPSRVLDAAVFGMSENQGIYMTGAIGVTSRAFELNTNLTTTIPSGSVGIVAHSDDTVYVATGASTIVEYSFSQAPMQTKVLPGVPEAGFMVEGADPADASFFLVASGTSIVKLLTTAETVAGPYEGLGAFAYDSDSRRLFIPLARTSDQKGRVLVTTLSP